jgi:hypothetical protein
LAGLRIESGNLLTPSGEAYFGIKVTTGPWFQASEAVRTYEDVEKILHSNGSQFKIHEERTEAGLFRSYVVET